MNRHACRPTAPSSTRAILDHVNVSIDEVADVPHVSVLLLHAAYQGLLSGYRLEAPGVAASAGDWRRPQSWCARIRLRRRPLRVGARRRRSMPATQAG